MRWFRSRVDINETFVLIYDAIDNTIVTSEWTVPSPTSFALCVYDSKRKYVHIIGGLRNGNDCDNLWKIHIKRLIPNFLDVRTISFILKQWSNRKWLRDLTQIVTKYLWKKFESCLCTSYYKIAHWVAHLAHDTLAFVEFPCTLLFCFNNY